MLDRERIPRHVAIIMDGNGRWAKAHGVPRVAGHNAGMKAMKKIVDHSDKLGVEYLTVYAFSTENWKRSVEEVGGIFKLLVKYVAQDLRELVENNVHVNILGDYSAIPEDARKSLEKTLEQTKENDGLKFNIAINYGSRDEIRRSVQEIADLVREGQIEPEDITEEMIGAHLFTGHEDIPDPEVVIRTSGEERLSNFLMWQCAYSEFVFVDELWPDFT
ncbi:MAG: isoprenyl transferase, partial [Firmicutes bacterium]|nr:isoprenyl transferase [Bacillota bacterium]